MKLISNLRRALRYLYLSYKLFKASRQADALQRATGITHFVVKGRDESLLVLTRRQYKRLVTKHKARYVTSHQMYQGCFYCTRWYSNDRPTPPEVIQRKRRIFFAAFGL